MRQIDSNTLASLNGSRQGDQLLVWPWYNGQPTSAAPLDLAAWGLAFDDTTEWGTLSLSVVDPAGRSTPWYFDDPLGVGGALLQAVYQVGGAGTVNMGWYRLVQNQPHETWSAFMVSETGAVTPNSPVPPGQLLTMQPDGATMAITGNELSLMVANDQFLAPESPQGSAPTVMSEITRLLQNHMPVVYASTLTDTAVPFTLIYPQQGDRWAACMDLAARIGGALRMNGDGVCEVYDLNHKTSVQNLYAGPGGVVVSWDRTQVYNKMYNFFVADGTATINGQSQPVRGTSQIAGGPLAFGGPHGRYPTFYSSTLLTTQAAADAYAQLMRDTQLAGMYVDIVVTTAPMPHLMIGDWVTVAQPVVDGLAMPLVGRVVTMALGSTAAEAFPGSSSTGGPPTASTNGIGTTVAPQTMTVRCSYNDVVAALESTRITVAGPVNRVGSGNTSSGSSSSTTTPAMYPSPSLFPSPTLFPG